MRQFAEFLIVLLIICLFGVAGCSSGSSIGPKAPVDEIDDGVTPDGDPDPCVVAEGAALPEECTTDEGAGNGDDGDGSDAGKAPGVNLGEGDDQGDDQDAVDPVKITRRSDTLEGCSYGSVFPNQDLRARGGSGKYVWTIEGLPSGLTWAKAGEDGKKIEISGNCNVADIFKITAKVADEADPAREDTREFELVVSDTIVISVQTGKDGGWKTAEESETGSYHLSIKFGERLKFEVPNHGTGPVKWTVSGYKYECDGDDAVNYCEAREFSVRCEAAASNGNCEGTDQKLTLKVSRSANNSSKMILEPARNYSGTHFLKVTVKAEVDDGGSDEAFADYVVFDPDPCSIPLSIKSEQLRDGEPITMVNDYQVSGYVERRGRVEISNIFPGQTVKVRYTVSGGKKPYMWGPDRGTFTYGVAKQNNDNSQITITKTVHFNELPEDLGEDAELNGSFTFTDQCARPNKAVATLKLRVKPFKFDPASVKHGLRLAALDTDGGSKLSLSIKKTGGMRDANYAGWGHGKINLHDYECTDDNWDNCLKLVKDPPPLIFNYLDDNAGELNAANDGNDVRNLQWVYFWFNTGSADDADFDLKISTYRIDAGEWCGEMVRGVDPWEGEYEDENKWFSAGFPIHWSGKTNGSCEWQFSTGTHASGVEDAHGHFGYN